MTGIKAKKIREAWRLFHAGFGKYKPQILILTVLGFLSGLLEAVGINAVIPLFSFVTGSTAGTDVISRAIVRIFSFLNLPFNLRFLLIFIISLFILKALAMIAFHYIHTKITADYQKEAMGDLFQKTLESDWSYLLRQKTAYLERVLMNDIAQTTYLLKYLSQTILLITSLTMYTLVALNISAPITLSVFAMGGIVFLALKRFVYKTRLASHAYAEADKQTAHHLSQNIIGVKTVKAMNVEIPVYKKALEYFDKLRNLRIRTFLLQNTTQELLEPVGLIFITIVFAIIYRRPGFNFASFAVIIYLINRIFGYLQNAQMRLHNVNEFIPYLRTCVKYLTEAKAHRENFRNDGADFKFVQNLQFKNVTFAYAGTGPILENLNFTIRKGQMIGLIGPSGAGKTTIVDLLLRLFNPSGGQILLDGLNMREISMRQWRKNIGYVSQDIFLLNDTIANNVKFYEPFSDNEIMEAARVANIADFIRAQPLGLGTIVGERGVLLSMGQRQRIVLARVLVRRPELLILDEATSALDNESEVAIQKAIENLRGKITVLVVAHRLSTVINADELLVLEDGQITEQGVPQKLLENQGSYFYKVYNIRERSQT